MTNPKLTYRISWILSAVLIWEVVFWCLSYGVFIAVNSSSSEKFSFLSPDYFIFLACLVPIWILYLCHLVNSNNQLSKFPLNSRFSLFKPVSSFHSFLRYFFFRNAIVFLIFSLAQPVFGTQKAKGSLKNLELIICLDISNSMNTRDIDPQLSRLDISKRALSELMNKLSGQKIGIVVFAGGSFVQLPLTYDFEAGKMFVHEITTDMISKQGTNISAALKTAKNMFSRDKSSKIVLLVTDGENHEENPSETISQLTENDIDLCIMGIGSSHGGPVPIDYNRPELGFKRDASGNTIISRVNQKMIASLAKLSSGTAVISSNPFPDLSALLTQINQKRVPQKGFFELDVKENRYQIPLFVALICWVLFLTTGKYIFSKKSAS